MLAPELEQELRYIEIAVSRRIRGLNIGQSRSRIRGSGFEFDAHRKYEVGEDFRRIDWNVSARTQQLYLKRHLEEKEVTVFLMVDVSRSMHFSTAAHSKRLRVVQIAATLGFSAISDYCNFGLLAFSDQVEAYQAPRKGRGHAWRALETLHRLQPSHKGTNLATTLRFVRSQLRRMSVIFLLSDFIAGPGAPELADLPEFKILTQRHDVVPIVIADELESNLPRGRGLLRFRSAESGDESVLSLSSWKRKQYEALTKQRRSDLQELFYSLGMDCLFLSAAEEFMDPLMTLFERRRRA